MTASVNELELYKEIFEKEPSAIIVLDERGVVKKANDSALKMLNVEALEGRKWYQVIDEVFRPQKDDGQEISTVDGKTSTGINQTFISRSVSSNDRSDRDP